jgi:hypothetical protein
MKLDNMPEPVLAPEYREGFICPKCSTAGPLMRPLRMVEGFTLRVECASCGFYTDYLVGGRDDA